MYFTNWKILSIIFGLTLIFSISTYPVFAENYVIGTYGSFGSDLGKYSINQGEEIQIRISGNGPMPPGTNYERVYLTITLPDGTQDGHRLFSDENGYFELFLPIKYDSQVGTYSVFATFAGQVLGTIDFEVERKAISNYGITPGHTSPIENKLSSGVTPSQNYITFRDQEFLINYPDNWKLETGSYTDNVTNETFKKIEFFDNNSGPNYNVVSISLQPLPQDARLVEFMPSEMRFDLFQDVVNDQMQDNSISNFGQVSKINKEINGIDFFIFEYDVTYKNFGNLGPTKITEIFSNGITSNGKIFFSYAEILPDDKYLVKPVVEKMINSIQLTSSSVVPLEPPVTTPSVTTSPSEPEPPVVQQEPVPTVQVPDESDPTGGIVAFVVIFLIILIIAKKKMGKKKIQPKPSKRTFPKPEPKPEPVPEIGGSPITPYLKVRMELLKLKKDYAKMMTERNRINIKIQNEISENLEFYKSKTTELKSLNQILSYTKTDLGKQQKMLQSVNIDAIPKGMKDLFKLQNLISKVRIDTQPLIDSLETYEKLANKLILTRKQEQRNVKPTTHPDIPVIENSLDEDLEKLKPTLPKKNKKNTKEIDAETANQIKKELAELRTTLENQKKTKKKTTKPKTKLKLKPEPEPKSKLKPEPEPKLKPEPEPKLKPEPKSEIEDIEIIKKLTAKMVRNYILTKNTINKDIKFKLISAYLKEKSIKKMCKLYPKLSKAQIQRHLVTIKRLPDELQELESNGSLHQNPKLSIVIALFATDHFDWDGGIHNQDEVITLAKSIAKYLKMDKELDEKFQGIQNSNSKIDLDIEREIIYKKYKFDNYKDEWKKGDRLHFQYLALRNHKNIDVVKFFCKWEFDNKNRFPYDLAEPLLKNPEKFFEVQNRDAIRRDKQEKRRKKTEVREDFPIFDDESF